MSDRPIFDTDNRLTDKVGGMGRRELIELMKKLCSIVAEQARETGFRGGVRPDNISVGPNGSVAIGPGGKTEKDKWTANELEFMAPEEFWNGECSCRSDVYSIGLVLYYCVSGGHLPFEPDTAQITANERAETLRRRMSGEKIKAPKTAGRSLGAIIEKAVAFKAEERYSSPADMPLVLELCLRELDSVDVNAPDSQQIFNKPEKELTDVEKMMVGIISKAAEDAALAGDDDLADVETEPADDIDFNEKGRPEQDEPEAVTDETIAITPAEPEPAPQPPEPEEPPIREEPVVTEETVVMKTPAEKPAAREEKPAPAPAPEKKKAPQRPTATPAVQYGMEKEKPVRKEKPRNKNSRKPVITVLVLCAAIIILAIVVKSFAGGAKPAEPSAEPLASAAVTPSAQPTPTPEPTPTPTPSPAAESTYQFFKEDISWTEAENKCEALGGHLVVIDSKAELDKVVKMAADNGVRFVWLGCQRGNNGKMAWVNGAEGYFKWAQGEPSGAESDGTPENYAILWNTEKDLSGDWEYNDVGNDPVSIYPKGYSGQISYICEIDAK